MIHDQAGDFDRITLRLCSLPMSPHDDDAPQRRRDDDAGLRGVSFTVKELFLEVKQAVDRLSEKVDVELRAINTHVNTLERLGSQQAQDALKEVRSLDRRVDELEKNSASRAAVEQNERYIRTLAVTVILAAGGWIVSIIVNLARH